MWCPQHLITLQQCRAIQHETTWVCPRRRIRGLCVRKKGDSYVLTYNDYEDEQGNARKGVKKTLEAGQSSSKFCACWQPTDRSLFCLGMFKETYSLHWISLIIQKSCFAAPLVCSSLNSHIFTLCFLIWIFCSDPDWSGGCCHWCGWCQQPCGQGYRSWRLWVCHRLPGDSSDIMSMLVVGFQRWLKELIEAEFNTETWEQVAEWPLTAEIEKTEEQGPRMSSRSIAQSLSWTLTIWV